jgi:hypothetical protein
MSSKRGAAKPAAHHPMLPNCCGAACATAATPAPRAPTAMPRPRGCTSGPYAGAAANACPRSHPLARTKPGAVKPRRERAGRPILLRPHPPLDPLRLPMDRPIAASCAMPPAGAAPTATAVPESPLPGLAPRGSTTGGAAAPPPPPTTAAALHHRPPTQQQLRGPR